MVKKILVLTSGSKTKIRDFRPYAETASLGDIVFSSESDAIFLKGGKSLESFDAIYFRLVGKSLENASLVADFASKKGIQIVDRVYSKSRIFPITQSKALEMKALIDGHIRIPRTFFASLPQIGKKAPKFLGLPFVVKSTSGRKGREVYLIKQKEDLKKLEETGKNYFAQEFIAAERRIRVLVVGGRILGAISQIAKWAKDRKGAKIEIFNPDKKVSDLALSAVRAVGLDIAGVDILTGPEGSLYVIEVNAAPSWELIKKYCQINVENEIIQFIQKKV